MSRSAFLIDRLSCLLLTRPPSLLPPSLPPSLGDRLRLQQGRQIEKICAMTNWDYYEAVER
jgi:hypothetical protein